MHARLLIVVMIFLLFYTPVAHAGFVVKKASLASGYVSAKTETKDIRLSGHGKSNSFFARFHDRLGMFNPGKDYRPYHPIRPGDWYGIAAIGCGVIGLLVPGVNLLALLFGVLGLGRGCKTKGLAIAGFIMGILELIVFLLLGTTVISLILL